MLTTVPTRALRVSSRAHSRLRAPRPIAVRFIARVSSRRANVAAPNARASPASARLDRSKHVRCHGLPIPFVGGLFNAPLATFIYVAVAIKMFLGYDRTNFGTGAPKVVVVGLWPVLALLSAKFRDNMKRAM